jgi:hypothetical protein
VAILRWTGKGWLSYLVVVASFAIGALVASPLRGVLPEVGGRNPGVVIVVCLVVATVAHGSATPTAQEAGALVQSLVELARAFPPGLAERYGSPPAGDPPYAAAR